MTLVDSAETMLDDFRPALRPDNLARRYGNEIVAWSSIRDYPTYLDPIAAVVFQIVDGEATVADLISDVHAELGVDREVADVQIRQSLELLNIGGLIETSPSEGAAPTAPDIFAHPPST